MLCRDPPVEVFYWIIGSAFFSLIPFLLVVAVEPFLLFPPIPLVPFTFSQKPNSSFVVEWRGTKHPESLTRTCTPLCVYGDWGGSPSEREWENAGYRDDKTHQSWNQISPSTPDVSGVWKSLRWRLSKMYPANHSNFERPCAISWIFILPFFRSLLSCSECYLTGPFPYLFGGMTTKEIHQLLPDAEKSVSPPYPLFCPSFHPSNPLPALPTNSRQQQSILPQYQPTLSHLIFLISFKISYLNPSYRDELKGEP